MRDQKVDKEAGAAMGKTIEEDRPHIKHLDSESIVKNRGGIQLLLVRESAVSDIGHHQKTEKRVESQDGSHLFDEGGILTSPSQHEAQGIRRGIFHFSESSS
jgi:hypothetical protein